MESQNKKLTIIKSIDNENKCKIKLLKVDYRKNKTTFFN